MKIKDYISKSIQEYPSLYKDVDYEKSKLKVLNQIFFVIGNGLSMAHTDNPKEGGYVVEPKHKKDKETGEYIRRTDKPYGKEKFKAIPKGYFENVVYYVYSGGGSPLETTFRKDEGGGKAYFRYDKEDIENEYNKPKIYEAKSLHSFSPYPISNYSLIHEVLYKDVFLQEDWMQELIILSKKTLEYFNDENQYKENSYYPSKRAIENDVKVFKKRFKEGGLKGLNGLQKTWDYEVKDSIPDYVEVEARKNDVWEKFYTEQLEILYGFLEKFVTN